MIDFTSLEEILNKYTGSEKKKTIIYHNKKYLVKFPDPIKEKNKNIFFINNTYSDYVGSNVFKLCGFNVQNTILGIYYYNHKKKIVCACEDFTDADSELYEFENLALSINPDKKIGTELKDVLEVLNSMKNFINTNASQQFFDMFVIDALIGNTDRHNSNWGFLYHKKDNTIDFAPIYDNGSCLNPMLEDSELEKLDDIELKNIIYNVYSCLKINNKKIHYFEFIQSMENTECNKALIRVFPRIDISRIKEFILRIEGMSDIRKEFYKKVIEGRYQILESVYKKLEKLD